MNERLGAMPMVAGNTFELLPEYHSSLAAMTTAIREARHTVHVEFYIMSSDEVTKDFFDALGEAVARGVEVRVLFDHLASLRVTGYRDLIADLKRLGVEFRAMLPWQPWRGVYQRFDLRNHRKLLVVDSHIAFTGSQNIIEPGYRKKRHRISGLTWLDLMIKIEGPIADSLEALFVSDWYQETDELSKPRNQNPPSPTRARRSGARWCPVDQPLRAKTTSGCSTPWSTARASGSSCQAPTLFPMNPCGMPSPPRRSVGWT